MLKMSSFSSETHTFKAGLIATKLVKFYTNLSMAIFFKHCSTFETVPVKHTNNMGEENFAFLSRANK